MDIETVKDRAGPREFSPKDDLPEEYRKAATRMLQFHANSEIMGAYLERPFIRQAPSLERKMAFSAKVQDEIGHGQLLYRAAESLGVKTREEMLTELENGKGHVEDLELSRLKRERLYLKQQMEFLRRSHERALQS